MNKRILLKMNMIVIFIIGIFLIYYFFFSLSAVLDRFGFDKEDIVTVESYSFNESNLTQVYLLANEKKLGIVGLKKVWSLFWKTSSVGEFIVDETTNSPYAFATVVYKDFQQGSPISETHLYVARYILHDHQPIIDDHVDFDLDIQYIPYQNKTILFAHAIKGMNQTSIGSEEVISYIESHFDSNAEPKN